MNVSGIGTRSALGIQSLLDMRRQLDDLQRQLGTGQKSDTYAGIGLDRGLAVGLRAQSQALSAYDDAITNVKVRIDLAQNTLGRLSEIGRDVKSAALQTADINSAGGNVAQATASTSLTEMLGLLNTRVGDRYLFSGRAADQPAVETLNHIMNGDGVRAGFQQIVAQRKQADLGANGLGRLVISAPTATSVAVAEDVAGSPFGLKLASVSSTLSNATVTGPAGSPAATSIDFTGSPNAGETIQYRFTLPDGTTDSVTLTATASATPGPNEFTIGATPAATAANFQAALTASIATLGDTSLTAASAVAAGNDFFNVDSANPPRRVAGPPYDTATALISGTAADTVTWYTGEAGTDAARGTAAARVDPSLTVAYGLRANEQGIRWAVQNVATLAAVTFSASDPNAKLQAAALGSRVGSNLDAPPGVQKIDDIEAELAGAQSTIAAASDRHRQTTSMLSDLLEQIEGVPTEQVAAQILALQTRMQASLQTTSMLYRMSLVNFL